MLSLPLGKASYFPVRGIRQQDTLNALYVGFVVIVVSELVTENVTHVVISWPLKVFLGIFVFTLKRKIGKDECLTICGLNT